MNVTEPLVLKGDVVLIAVADLAADLRAKFTCEEGDFTLSRRHGRMPSQVIDGETASLLKLFAKPRTIVDAVLENSRTLARNPAEWLEELLPHIGTFLTNRVLVAPGSDDEQEMQQRLANGTEAGEWHVLQCIAMVEDSEIYRVRGRGVDAALKIARLPTPLEGSLFANEIAILQMLGGDAAPRLHDHGVLDERPYLVIEWCPGVDAGTAAAHRRHDRVALLDLCSGIALAYAALHERKVIHSDVHPRNVIVDEDGTVRLIDFGLARAEDERARVGRGGMYYFFEPEFHAARRNGRNAPSTAAGEQYSVAALLYLLITNSHYVDFRYEKDEMARQAETEAPVAFADRGMPPWPDVEQPLLRALQKDPALRFASMRDFATTLVRARDAAAADALATPLSPEALQLLDDEVRRLTRGGDVFSTHYEIAPTGSINYGSAGAAAGLLRIACARGDASLLAAAAVWYSRALGHAGNPASFYNAALEIGPEVLGPVSPYHTESGIHAAGALIAHARGDETAFRSAVAAFVRASNIPCEELDVTLGRSGTLLAASLLLDVTAGSAGAEYPETAVLRALGDETMHDIWRQLDERPPLADSPANTFLGIAHGWAGYLYAALHWAHSSGADLPRGAATRLEELAAQRVRRGNTSYWKRQVGSGARDVMAGWCNGSAGYVFLWTLAHRVTGDERWLKIAEEVAQHAWEEPMQTADLCCGSAGRAYAYLNLYKHTGATIWLSRARHAANHAASTASATAARPHALWKGELGVAVLIADLASPETAAMPFFESA